MFDCQWIRERKQQDKLICPPTIIRQLNFYWENERVIDLIVIGDKKGLNKLLDHGFAQI